MPLESGTYISDLNASNPAHSDPLSQTDAHLRLVKSALLNTFPLVSGACGISHVHLTNLGLGWVDVIDGNAGAPAIRFFTDLSTGFYKAGTGVVGLTGGLSISGRYSGDGACPTGMIADFLTGAIPTGWYELNGQAVLRTGATAGLFAIYGTNYGAGDGVNSFNLPNLNDRYRRSRGSWTVATFLADAIKSHAVSVSVTGGDHNHTGTTNNGGVDHTHPILTRGGLQQDAGPSGNGWATDTAGNTGGASAYLHAHSFTTSNSGPLSLSASASYSGDFETRPSTVVVVTCVKA